MIREPEIHSHVTDGLEDSNPLAWENVYCTRCNDFLHCNNNECMTNWVETGKGNFCFKCWMIELKKADSILAMDEEWGL